MCTLFQGKEEQKPLKNISLPKGNSSDTKIEEEVALAAPKITFQTVLSNTITLETGYSMTIECTAAGNSSLRCPKIKTTACNENYYWLY